MQETYNSNYDEKEQDLKLKEDEIQKLRKAVKDMAIQVEEQEKRMKKTDSLAAYTNISSHRQLDTTPLFSDIELLRENEFLKSRIAVQQEQLMNMDTQVIMQ